MRERHIPSIEIDYTPRIDMKVIQPNGGRADVPRCSIESNGTAESGSTEAVGCGG